MSWPFRPLTPCFGRAARPGRGSADRAIFFGQNDTVAPLLDSRSTGNAR
jgi:hypothetical protein